MSKNAFVTVGTTRFDALVNAFDSETLQQSLVSKGYNALVIQRG